MTLPYTTHEILIDGHWLPVMMERLRTGRRGGLPRHYYLARGGWRLTEKEFDRLAAKGQTREAYREN